MQGRDEMERKIEQYNRDLLNRKSNLINEYYYSLSDKTAATKKMYLIHVTDFCDYIGESNVVMAKPVDINKFLAKTKAKSTTLNVKLYALKNFYEFLINNGYCEKNPCLNVKIQKDRKERTIVAMDASEVKTLKDNISNGVGNLRSIARQKKWRTRDNAIVTIGCSTGMRVSEITGINISDIDFENNTLISTGKGNKTRDIYFGESTKSVIKEWLEDRDKLMQGFSNNDALFISNRRQRIANRTVEDLISKYTYNLDKHISPHKMRSTCATNLLDKTGNIYLVQQQLGHSNIETTKRYAKISDESRKNAANILDSLF